jgi:2-polyprenyl-6-methoxyphenol hydroxylase-like FAD-dependent oxidoreductase
MKIGILGAGPAGLYGAYLLKRARPDVDIRVVEQNPADATFGFGVVFSEQALGFLARDDPQTHAYITPHMEAWNDLTVVHRDVSIAIDGVGFTAIGRLQLLRLLQDRARSVGVEPRFESPASSLDAFADADLVIGADGVNSLVRNSRASEFGATVMHGSNKFIWYGVSKPYPTLTQTFRETDHGALTVHHYRYAPDRSTFLVEVDAPTWQRTGFGRMDAAATRAYCEQVFESELDGHRLVANKSVWRNFPVVHNQRWWTGNKVLVGDALHTAHFSIGSGTRLAMEDMIALVKALGEHPGSVREALESYESSRRPIVETLVKAANASMSWYEHMGEHMRLTPHDFVYSYITRSGRISDERLRQIAPSFMATYEQHRGSAAAQGKEK